MSKSGFPLFLWNCLNNDVDVLLISETKIDSSLLTARFYIQGNLIPYGLDRTINSGVIFLYIRDDLPSTLLQRDIQTEEIFFRIKSKGKKCPFCCSNNSNRNRISNHLKEIGGNIDNHSSNFENLSFKSTSAVRRLSLPLKIFV